MKKIISIMLTVSFVMALSAQTPKGTYIPKNDVAKSLHYEKFVFSGSKVKTYIGMNGMSLGVSYEYSYTLSGNTLSIKEGAGSVDFTYNKAKEEISILEGGAVWGKQGTFDPNNPYSEKDNEKTVSSEQGKKEQDKTTTEQISNTKGETWNYNPYTFYQDLAETCAAYSSEAYHQSYIDSHLKTDGYTGIMTCFNYEENGIGYTIAYKEVNGDEILLAVVIRGTVGNEWFGNMDIWETKNKQEPVGRHYSFQNANMELQKAINNYIRDTKELQSKNINFLVTGHSRGGAVANLLAVDLNNMTFIKNAKTKNVYAYTFATPNNRKDFNDKEYNNIFNFCFVDDFVTGVPLEKWGYGKSGKTYIAVAEGLSYINDDFKNYIKSNKLEFNYAATADVIRDIYLLTNSVERYYNKKLAMEPLHGLTGHLYNFFVQKKLPFLPKADPEEDKTLHEFMRDYIANAKIYGFGDISAAIGTALKQSPIGNDVHNIAIYFVDGINARKSVGDTHEMNTYLYALKYNGFLTK